MKRFLPLVVVTILAGTIAFGITQWFRHASCPDEDTWLRTEFALSDAQIAAIRKIREEYEPTCASHCGKISAAKQKLATAEKTNGVSSADHLKAQAELEAVTRACAESTRRLVEAIAAQMPVEEGRRYLAMVGPKITSTSAAHPPSTP